MTSGPLWLQSGPVSELLNLLVDRLDSAEQRGSAKTQSVALDEKTWPALYKAPMESTKEDLWEHLVEMASWRWLKVRSESSLASSSGYASSPRVAVINEEAVRQAVGRAMRRRSTVERWREAVNRGLEATEAVKRAVGDYCIDMPDRSMVAIIQQLNQLPALASKPMLLREVSSQLFWGMSKVLDKRQGLVAAVLGMDECPFPESPIQLQAYLPSAGCNGVLFIENLMSFDQATRSTSRAFEGLAVVFASGYKGSARRLRSPAGCSLFYSNRGELEETLRDEFEAWLFGSETKKAFFWGDLDWEGMRILAAMRGSFGGLSAWKPGYAPMLAALCAGRGHTPQAADKQGQKALAFTGCGYADSELLPALHATSKFVDQEQWNP